jgi:hypothetical protein
MNRFLFFGSVRGEFQILLPLGLPLKVNDFLGFSGVQKVNFFVTFLVFFDFLVTFWQGS